MRIVLPPPTERTEVKTLGDVRIKVVERGNRILSLEIHQSGSVPVIDRFSPEVMQKAQRWWWSTSRERRILREAGKQGRLNYEIVRQALLHDRAATIDLRMQRNKARAQAREEKDTPKAAQRRPFRMPLRHPLQQRHFRLRGGTALALPEPPQRPLTLTEIAARELKAEPAQPRPVSERTRSR